MLPATTVLPRRKKKTPSRRPLEGRLRALEAILDYLDPVPKQWLRIDSRASSSVKLSCLPCKRYRELTSAWRKAMRWTVGLDHALAVMLASIASTKSLGDQLWIKVIGPAACGKSTLCEAVSVNRKHVLAKSTIRGFHSGFRGGDNGKDNSLVAKLYDKTLVTKDGDTLLKSPNLGQILSEARDLYDSTSRTHYRNSMSRDYQGVRMTWLLCGTSSLRSIDNSELGERFLDCVIMERIEDDMEDEILKIVARKADGNLSLEANGKAETQYEPELAKAMQKTGGYVDYLRENAQQTLSEIESPEWTLDRCTRLGKFVAHMRARPSSNQEENAERELAARLVSQHVRLAKCLAFVLNKSKVDARVMRRVTRVALDTSRGQTLEIVNHLVENEEGLEPKALSVLTNRTEHKIRYMLRFLRAIEVVEVFRTVGSRGTALRPKWRLTERMQELYREVHEGMRNNNA